MHFAVAAFFLTILLLTTLREVKVIEDWMRNFGTFTQFIPKWSFFAPIPNMHDYYLLYRGFKNNGFCQEWQEYFITKSERSTMCFLWNPQKRLLKGYIDIAQDLLRLSSLSEDKSQICTSLPYLQILWFVDGLVCDAEIKKVQFMVLSNSKSNGYEMKFISEIHPLTNRGL